jgi:hypothetical protein
MKKGQKLNRPESIGIGIRISKDMNGSAQIIAEENGISKNMVIKKLLEYAMVLVFKYGYKPLINNELEISEK